MMCRGTSFHIFMAAFIMVSLSSFTIIYQVQGQLSTNTRHRQCQMHGYQVACSGFSHSCDTLTCGRLAPEGIHVLHTIKSKRGVELGTACGVNKICENKKCVHATPPLPIYEGEDIFSECKPAQPLVLSYTRSQQCKDYGHSGVCRDRSNSCHELHCARQVQNSEGRIGYRNRKVIPPLGVQIGTHCGPSHICVNGKCVNAIGAMPLNIGDQTIHDCLMADSRSELLVGTRHQQCLDYGMNAACESDQCTENDGCRYLYCGYEVFPEYYVLSSHINGNDGVRTTVATGTKCGESGICYNKTCVTKPPPSTPRITAIGEEIYKKCHRLK